jgi:hypothetical protein
MPIIIGLLFLVGLYLFLRDRNPYVNPNDPLPSVQEQMRRAAQASANTQTQGIQLTELQAAQIKKFSAIATIAGTATTVGVAGLSSLTLAAAGPVGAAVAAAIVAIGALRGTAHLVANQWTSGVQKQFNEAFLGLSGEVQRATSNGSITKASLSSAIYSLTVLWSQYYDAGERFAAQDKDHRLVIDQSYCDYINFRCPSGHKPLGQDGIVNDTLRDWQAQYNRLKI